MFIRYILIFLLLLICPSAIGFTVDDWMRGGSSKSSSCEEHCKDKYDFCRSIANDKSYRGAGAWAEDMKECKKEYKDCLNYCIKND